MEPGTAGGSPAWLGLRSGGGSQPAAALVLSSVMGDFSQCAQDCGDCCIFGRFRAGSLCVFWCPLSPYPALQNTSLKARRSAASWCRAQPALALPRPEIILVPNPPCSDSSPIMVELRDVRPGLLRLLVRTCAVVGGAFAVTGLWDKLVHRAVTSIKKHMA